MQRNVTTMIVGLILALGMAGTYLIWLALDTGPFFVGLLIILGSFAGIGVVVFWHALPIGRHLVRQIGAIRTYSTTHIRKYGRLRVQRGSHDPRHLSHGVPPTRKRNLSMGMVDCVIRSHARSESLHRSPLSAVPPQVLTTFLLGTSFYITRRAHGWAGRPDNHGRPVGLFGAAA